MKTEIDKIISETRDKILVWQVRNPNNWVEDDAIDEILRMAIEKAIDQHERGRTGV